VLHALLRLVARVALSWYYRSIEVINLERVPADGAVILAANHPNAMVDALVVGTSLGRRVRLTAKATLLEQPLTRWIVRSLGIVPLRRTSDESASRDPAVPDRNATAFEAVVDALRAGEVVLIFPEGRSHSEPSLSELRTGCARIALQSRAAGVDPLTIVPVGITFEHKEQPRSRVAVRFGQPLGIVETGGPQPDRVVDLTARLDIGLRAVTLNFESHEEAARVLLVSGLLAAATPRVGPLDEAEPSLEGTLHVVDRVDEARRRVAALPEQAARRVGSFLDRLDAFQRDLRKRDVPIPELWIDLGWQSALLFAARELLVFVIAGPVALWGRLNHWLPLRAAFWLGRVTSRNRDEPAMRTLIVGILFVLAFYGLATTLVGATFGWVAALGYLVSLPPSASTYFWAAERWQHAVRRARTWLQFRRHPGEQRRLITEAAALRAEAERLETALTDRGRSTGDPTEGGETDR
jgi:1-acyl-sn-glycerol-3-phosphate acyltransferase